MNDHAALIHSLQIMIPIETLNLPTGPYNCLKRADVNTVDDIITLGKQNLLKIKNFGNGALDLVVRALKDINVTLTNEGLPLASLSPWAKSLIDLLGLGDTKQIRQGLADVIIFSLANYKTENARFQLLAIAKELKS